MVFKAAFISLSVTDAGFFFSCIPLYSPISNVGKTSIVTSKLRGLPNSILISLISGSPTGDNLFFSTASSYVLLTNFCFTSSMSLSPNFLSTRLLGALPFLKPGKSAILHNSFSCSCHSSSIFSFDISTLSNFLQGPISSISTFILLLIRIL